MREPSGLYEAGKRAYREAVATLEALGEDPQHSAGAVELYARASDDLAHYRRQWTSAGKPTTTVSEHGRGLPHPLPRLIADQSVLVAKLGAKIGLTPDGRTTIRRMLGRPKGSTQAPDRPQLVRLAKD